MLPNKKEDIPKEVNKQTTSYLQYSGLAFEMLAVIGLGVFIGVKLDKWLNLKFPACTIILGLLFLALSMFRIVKSLQTK
ncbi:MAG: AtpZ/AtpI family protein [Chitinophagales bacterium]|nr:AtpZ/AtpI family protein [Chitinophagales bacterium]